MPSTSFSARRIRQVFHCLLRIFSNGRAIALAFRPVCRKIKAFQFRVKRRKTMIKKLLPLLVAGCAMALPGVAVAQDKPTICYVTFSLQVGYFQEGVDGAKKAADELGAELVVLDPQADAAKQ